MRYEMRILKCAKAQKNKTYKQLIRGEVFNFCESDYGAAEKTRTSMNRFTATSTLRVYQFRHGRLIIEMVPTERLELPTH